MTYRCRLRIALTLAAAAITPWCPGEVPRLVPTDDDDSADNASVYVGDSFETRSVLFRADRLAEAKRWREAAQAYRQAVEAFADKLVRLDAHTYVGPAAYANRRIAAWPDAGMKVYRLLYADEARRRLDRARSARDLSALLCLAEDCFCTSEGGTAADLAAELAMEAGDFSLARRLYTLLLERHPDRKTFAGELTGKLALSFAWAGRVERARALLEQIKSEHPEATLQWAGRSRRLTDVIDEAIAHRAPPLDPKGPFAWPTIGGSSKRDHVVGQSVRPSAPLWEYGPEQGFEPITADLAKQASRAVRGYVRADRARQHLSLLPVAAHGNLYLTDSMKVWAVHIADGSEAWPPYAAAKETPRSRTTQARNTPTPLHTCSLHKNRLFVVLGQPIEAMSRGLMPSGTLACLDADTGKPIWSVKLTDVDPELAEIRLDGAPVFYRDKLFAIGRRRKRFGFEDCYLIRFDAATGRLDWMRHLASASVGRYGNVRSTSSFPTICDATVLVCTNLGAIAAVNAHDGRIRWLRVYHKDRTEEEAGARFSRRVMPWEYAPPICWRDQLICRPLDSEYVLIVNREDGQIVRRINVGRLGHVEQVLGVVDDVLYTAGRELVAWDLTQHESRWSRSLSSGGGLAGRGQLTHSHAYLPMGKGMYRFALRGGDPGLYEWPENAVGGNVFVTPGLVAVAGSDRLTGYVPRDEAFARLLRRIRAAPTDPMPRLDLAEVAFRVGERRRGIDALNRAVEVCGGFAGIRDARVKARVFHDFVRFGDKVRDEGSPDESLALELYQQAAQCPPDTDAQVLYRLRLAQTFARTRQFGSAIEQYQQIIADPSLRHRPTPSVDGEPTRPNAGQWAERQIATILSEQGRQAYATFERQAETMLAVGRDQRDVEIIQQVIDAFPNSKAARKGVLAKAELLEQRGQYRQAVRAYLQVLHRSAKGADVPRIMRRVAEAYLRSDRPFAAGRWLARGAVMFPDHRFDHQGRSIGFAEYAELVSRGRPTGPPLPAFSLPMKKGWSREFDTWVTILPPSQADLPGTRWDLFVTHCGGKIEAFTALDNRPMWPTPVRCDSKPNLLGMTRRNLVLATRRRLLGVQIDTGQLVWSVAAHASSADGPGVDPEEVRRWVNWKMTEDRVFGVLDNGQAVCVDADQGQVIWRGQLTSKLHNPPVVNDEFFIHEAPTPQSGRLAIHVLDAETGRSLRTIETKTSGRAFWMAMSEQGMLLAASGRRIYAFDPYAGKLAWENTSRQFNHRYSLVLGTEGVYLSHNGRTIVRRSLSTGEIQAESPHLPGTPGSSIIPTMVGDHLFVRTPEAVTTLDAQSLRLIWRGTTNRNADLVSHQVGRPYVVAIDKGNPLPEGGRKRRYVAYFYDRREDSGLIPSEGGMVDLGMHDSVRGVWFADHTILIVEKNKLHGWTGPPK